ncbi:uncharacterized protein LOC132282344 [Cornus florida]|uniref:uncharacterized protein LOC132282344 n=1 Tax=Cornus florida TaxID=4283 RepID=UPI0028A1B568|nr:uncharacterized protein LOC132282344 [Cornus florida]
MNHCRSLFRVDRAWKLTNPYVISVSHLQCCSHHSLNYNWILGGTKDTQSAMDGKKGKKYTPTWRRKPLCTQSSSNEGCSVKDIKVEFNILPNVEDGGKLEVGNHVQEAQYSTYSGASNAQHAPEESEVANEPAETTLSSAELQDNDEGRVPGREPLLSAEKHSMSMEIGASLMRFIKGKEGSTQKKIEEEMGVKIIFPSSKKEDSIIIEGISTEDVTRALAKVQVIVDEVVKSPRLDYSHFVSLPLALHAELVDKLFNFQNCILGISDPNQDESLDSDSNECASEDDDKDQLLDRASDVSVKLTVNNDSEHVKLGLTNIRRVSYPPKTSKSSTSSADHKIQSSALSDLGIEKSIFIKPKTFHLTVLMLKLWNKDRVNAAAEVLQSVSSRVMDALDNRPVFIKLKGLECMKGSYNRARVLYAPIEEIGGEDRLLRACQVIIDAFVEAGLVLEKDAQQKLKLHATVMNARHRKSKKKTRNWDSFDARGIFKQYGSEEWGEYVIPEAHLSQRFMFDENGYYHCITCIPFPESN